LRSLAGGKYEIELAKGGSRRIKEAAGLRGELGGREGREGREGRGKK